MLCGTGEAVAVGSCAVPTVVAVGTGVPGRGVAAGCGVTMGLSVGVALGGGVGAGAPLPTWTAIIDASWPSIISRIAYGPAASDDVSQPA